MSPSASVDQASSRGDLGLPRASLPGLFVHGIAGWAICAAAMVGLPEIGPIGVAQVVHAIVAPLVFAALAAHLYLRTGGRAPLVVAGTFTGLMAGLDAVVVAGLIQRSPAMLTSVVGTWIPVATVFAVSLVTGILSWPGPSRADGVLTDTIELDAPADRVVSFFRALDRHYRAWHPDHGRFDVVAGSLDAKDAIVEFEEVLHGEPHRFRQRVTWRAGDGGATDISLTGARLRDRVLLKRARFHVEPVGDHARLASSLDIRLGKVLARLWPGRVDALTRHMREESLNLKRLVEDRAP